MKFLNTELDNLTMEEAIDQIEVLIKNKKPSYVVTPNVDHIVKLEQDEEFKKIYEDASLILPDGKPLLWIAKRMNTPIKEKVSGSDLFPKLCERASEKGYRMFFLGAKEGIAKQAAENLTKRFEGLEVVGTYSPSFGFEQKSDELNEIRNMIWKANPDILIVGLGCPKQEKFVHEYCKELGVPVALCLGASMDFEAGNIKRAPKWMQNVGLEWFYRLIKEPRRMFRRYLVDDIQIFQIYRKYRLDNE
ncbi:MAG: WecB/TagA/CpsF family glycosyltransferase [bacterium]|nr:WecB/TagA/CpsF family glycosyltransferase [bacterium]